MMNAFVQRILLYRVRPILSSGFLRFFAGVRCFLQGFILAIKGAIMSFHYRMYESEFVRLAACFGANSSPVFL